MTSLLWMSEVAFAYFLTSFLVAVCVGRFLRHSSVNDFDAVEAYMSDEAPAVPAREVKLLRSEVACVP